MRTVYLTNSLEILNNAQGFIVQKGNLSGVVICVPIKGKQESN